MRNMPSLEQVWNVLVPRCALDAKITNNPNRKARGRQCIRYTHPTKGFRYISKRRFAILGVH